MSSSPAHRESTSAEKRGGPAAWAWRRLREFAGVEGDATFFWTRWIVLRAVGVVFLFVFAGIIVQGQAIVAPNGIVTCLQVNPKFYPSKELMVAHATELAALAPNIAIKAPATDLGIAAMEEMTARGIRINATVSFTVAQALAVAAALERGLKCARAAGLNADAIRPYITLMIGRWTTT